MHFFCVCYGIDHSWAYIDSVSQSLKFHTLSILIMVILKLVTVHAVYLATSIGVIR